MISYLKGNIIGCLGNYIIVEVNNIGFRVLCNKSLPTNSKVELFVHEHIREDADDFYGFETIADLELFEKLISVNGVGPKAGMAIMASASSDEIILAIAQENVAFFKAISGIGTKAATKIILDLKSKIGQGKIATNILSISSESDDIFDALISLGYKKNELEKLVSKIPVELNSIEKKITWCLKNLAKG